MQFIIGLILVLFVSFLCMFVFINEVKQLKVDLIFKHNLNSSMFIIYLSGIMLGVFLTLIVPRWIGIPEAIDVYRGKTELEIKKIIVDGTRIDWDTTVVFKENAK